MANTPKLTICTGAKAWDIIWKWTWFARSQWQTTFRQHKEGSRRALSSLLGKLNISNILDCSCGLGWKTVLLAEMGYTTEGCDRSRRAVKYASELARDEGLTIRYFRATWATLGNTCGRKYDCIYNDAFTWLTSKRSLVSSAKGIRSALKDGGKFVFMGPHEWPDNVNKTRLIEQQFRQEGPFEALADCERDGVKLTTLIARELNDEGVLGSRIHIIDDHGTVRIEIARTLDLCKWTWQDCNDVVKQAGFKKFYTVREKAVGGRRCVLNVAVK